MCGFNQPQLAQRLPKTIARDRNPDEAAKHVFVLVMDFGCAPHTGGSLSASDDDDLSACRRNRKMTLHTTLGLRYGDGSVEKSAKETSGIK